MNYKSFNKFITEKSAQAAAKDWEKFGNRASRSMAKLNQKCGQLTGDAKTSCLYGQTDEEYVSEQASETASATTGSTDSAADEAKKKREKAAADRKAAEKAKSAAKPAGETTGQMGPNRPTAAANANTGQMGPNRPTAAANANTGQMGPNRPTAATTPAPKEQEPTLIAKKAAQAKANQQATQQQAIPANATQQKRQQIASANLAASQSARNVRDFGTATATPQQVAARSAQSRVAQADRRASRDDIMADSDSAAMKTAQRKIDAQNDLRKRQGKPPLNMATVQKMQAREANRFLSTQRDRATAAAAPAAGASPQAGAASPDTSAGPRNERGEVAISRKDTEGAIIGDENAAALATATNDLFNRKDAVGVGANVAANVGDAMSRGMRQDPTGIGGLVDKGYAGLVGSFFGGAGMRRALGSDYRRIRSNEIKQRDPNAPKVDTQAGVPEVKSGPTRQQVETDPRFAQIKGALAGERQTDADRGDVGAGSAAIKPGENASAARLRIDKELREKGLSQDKITAEMIRLGLRRPAPGSGGGNVSRTVDQSRTSGPTTPMQ